MQTIGLIGGMSWESTALYYRRINEQVRERLGGLHSADILLRSVDFAPIAELQRKGDWEAAGALLAGHALALEKAGASCIILCTNTMHKVAPAIQQAVSIPLLHIGDVTGEAVRKARVSKPLLLATRYTMEQDFYLSRLRDGFGLSPLVPDEADRIAVHDIIFNELCQGVVSDASRAHYLTIIDRAVQAGADSLILGCTEVGLLIGPQHTDLPLFDSTLLHADAALDFALAS